MAAKLQAAILQTASLQARNGTGPTLRWKAPVLASDYDNGQQAL